MTTPIPPAGWYPDPNDPSRQRWWDGARWAETPHCRGSRLGRGWRPTLSTWITAAIALLVGLIGAGANGFGGFLVGIALFGLGAGIWSLISRRPSWLNLPRTRRAAGAALGISFAVLLLGGMIAPHSAPKDQASGANADTSLAASSSPTAASMATPKSLSAPAPTPKSTPSPTPTPVTTVQVVETTEAIDFNRSSYEDPNVDAGSSVIVTAGVAGTKVSRWEVTLVDGVEKGRVLVSESVSVAPIDEVTAIGTRQAPAPPPEAAPAGDGCDPNYTGACVPIASDVDCAGGSGNGPAYVQGPVQVVGSDVYDLDRDGDGIACD